MRRISPLVAALLALASAPAAATFHLMSIREVYVGPVADPNAQYVELQMYVAGQNRVDNHVIRFYDAAGVQIGPNLTFTDDVPNGANQDYILIATTQAVTKFGVAADLVMPASLTPAGGKVCFEDIDCFTWGNYVGSATLPSPSGTPFNMVTGLAADTAVRRDISGGSSASMLDPADDTNDSAADFDAVVTPNPVNNGPPPSGGGAAAGGAAGGGGGYSGGGGGGSIPLVLLLVLAGLSGGRRLRAGPLERAERD